MPSAYLLAHVKITDPMPCEAYKRCRLKKVG
jgi:uncharacterized protein (DUF1330 family)